jgi:hypothetical protein
MIETFASIRDGVSLADIEAAVKTGSVEHVVAVFDGLAALQPRAAGASQRFLSGVAIANVVSDAMAAGSSAVPLCVPKRHGAS